MRLGMQFNPLSKHVLRTHPHATVYLFVSWFPTVELRKVNDTKDSACAHMRLCNRRFELSKRFRILMMTGKYDSKTLCVDTDFLISYIKSPLSKISGYESTK